MKLAMNSRVIGIAVGVALAASPAAAELPDAKTLLTNVGVAASDIAQIESGTLVRHTIQPASERELVAALAFQVPVTPTELVKDLRAGLLREVDPSMIASGTFSATPSVADLAKLTLAPDAAKRAAAYASAAPGDALNLSTEEIAAFGKLGAGAAPAAVEVALRAALLERVQSYRAKGLAGIAPYARSGGASRSPADELRTASKAAKNLEKYAPAASQLLLSYPQGKPPGTEESFGWSHFDAHGVPTIALIHGLFVPDGDAWLVVQRQLYVSTGYNAEQAVAAFLPVQGGTIVVYANRTSTDQITGFGGGTKRSIGSKMLASQLEGLFTRMRGAAK